MLRLCFSFGLVNGHFEHSENGRDAKSVEMKMKKIVQKLKKMISMEFLRRCVPRCLQHAEDPVHEGELHLLGADFNRSEVATCLNLFFCLRANYVLIFQV